MHPDLVRIRFAIALTIFWAIATNGSIAGDASRAEQVTLTLPRPANVGEAVWLEVRSNTLPRGADIVISTRDGGLVGTVSLVGDQGAKGGGVFSSLLPLPKREIVHGQVNLFIEVEVPGSSARAPKPGEVVSIKPIYVPVDN